MENNRIKLITYNGTIAALYAAITLVLSFLSYGPIQFRIAEILMLLILIDKRFFWGLTIGCLIANMFSPLGIIDVVVGTSATICALFYMMYVNKSIADAKKALIIASIGPAIFNAIFVGAELTILFKEMPFILNALYVAIGEFVVVSIVGVAIYPLLVRTCYKSGLQGRGSAPLV